MALNARLVAGLRFVLDGRLAVEVKELPVVFVVGQRLGSADTLLSIFIRFPANRISFFVMRHVVHFV